MRSISLSLSLPLFGIALLCASPAAAETQLKVESGQTLYGIAKRHGCTVEALQRANSIRGSTIYAGQTLVVPDCPKKGRKAGADKPDKRKKVGKAETAVYDRSPPAKVKPKKGQSIGAPWDGELRSGVKLAKGKGYHIRRPERAYGTTHAVDHVQKAIKAVRKRFPKVHTLAIGDLSDKDGGWLSMHHSHQSGRDIDLGLYFKTQPKGYPDSFVSYKSAKLDMAATWALLHAFARTADSPGGVQAIFLDFDLQGKLYEWAKDRSVPKDYLDKVFQYPTRGGRGLVRHEPGHEDHFHIRFKCPDNDAACER
jgi:murein endopeptidase